MARARNIKPGFFLNESLVEQPFEHRLLFVGLWTIADKAGRLEDRPKKIKMCVFPADDVDIEKGLAALTEAGFLIRYSIGEQSFIQIVNWDKHQSPHHTERDSEIPEYQPTTNGETTVKEQKGLRGNPPDSLIPDSLIPDSTPLADKSAQKRRTRIPADFYPNEVGVAKAEKAGVNVAIELQKFSDYHQGKGTAMLDWQAAWRTWISNAKQFGRSPNANHRNANADTIAAFTGQRQPAVSEGGSGFVVEGSGTRV